MDADQVMNQTMVLHGEGVPVSRQSDGMHELQLTVYPDPEFLVSVTNDVVVSMLLSL